jgi:hypothetical protein
LANPKYLSLAEYLDARAEELSNYSLAEALAPLTGGEATAEGLPIADDPGDYARIPAGWWAPGGVLPAEYSYLIGVEKNGRTSELTGITFVDRRHSGIWQNTVTGSPPLVGFRGVRVCTAAENDLATTPVRPRTGSPAIAQTIAEYIRHESGENRSFNKHRAWAFVHDKHPDARREDVWSEYDDALPGRTRGRPRGRR